MMHELCQQQQQLTKSAGTRSVHLVEHSLQAIFAVLFPLQRWPAGAVAAVAAGQAREACGTARLVSSSGATMPPAKNRWKESCTKRDEIQRIRNFLH